MTKQQELARIAATINKLREDPAGSYCAQWLSESLPFIESAMRSDFPAEIYTLSLDNWVKLREQQAADIITRAEEKAGRTIAHAQKQADEILGATINQISATEHELDTMRQRLADLRHRASNVANIIKSV
jgi:hypothetical protein